MGIIFIIVIMGIIIYCLKHIEEQKTMEVVLHDNGWWKCPKCGEHNYSLEEGSVGCVRCSFEGKVKKEK